jgi:hypothetical protein
VSSNSLFDPTRDLGSRLFGVFPRRERQRDERSLILAADAEAVARRAGDSEFRVNREAGPHRGMGFVKSTNLRKGGGQGEMCNAKFRLASIDRRNHATASSELPRWFFASPANAIHA